MPSPSLIDPNKTVKEIKLLSRRHWASWITVWPFVILYAIAFALYQNPELVWDKVTYLVNQTYIDFLHAAIPPIIILFHIFLSLFTVWSVRFRSMALFSTVSPQNIKRATHVLVRAQEHKGESEIVELVQEKKGFVTCFVFQQRKWKLDSETRKFMKPKFPVKHSFPHYIQWKGLNSTEERETALDVYGSNKMEVTIPEFFDLLVDHAFAPMFVFQMFCTLLWCLDEYWYYSIMSGMMTVVLECSVVFQRINNMKTLRKMGEVPLSQIEVIRGGERTMVQTDELLPMDLVVVPSNAPFPVDALLIRGTAVVNEASLTGESTPQLKEAPDNIDMGLNVKKHGRHMLFCGTQVLLSTGVGDEEGAVAVVLKTGFETKQGKLLRTILHSQGRISENSSESFGFIGVLVIFALTASAYVLKRGLADPSKDRWKIFLACVQVITSVVPSDLPMQMTMAVNNALKELSKLSIFCTEPFRIPFAGLVDTCCFDKTGTLTTDEMLFGGLDLGDGKGARKTLKGIPRMSEIVLLSCHSLVSLKDDIIAGDEMEKAGLGALGYRLDTPDTVVYDPPKLDKEGNPLKVFGGVEKKIQDPRKTLKIRARFPFLAALRRMSCVVESREGTFVVAKGSPEAIYGLCTDMPSSCLKLAEETASKGLRVIALAYRKMEGKEALGDVRNLSREMVEKDLKFAGLALYVCPLKKDARKTIENLQGGSLRCVIITGDSIQTAISVGRDVSLLDTNTFLVACPKEGSEEEVEWQLNGERIDATEQAIINKTRRRVCCSGFFNRGQLKTEGEWELCVNAENLSSKQFSYVVKHFSEQVAIWGRCAPAQKEEIVMDLKLKKHAVMMSGDGTNDVGALKQAQVGVAVLNSAAVAKPADPTIQVGPQPHNEPDLSQDLFMPPNFRLTEVPPQPGPEAGFMALSRWQVACGKRKAEIKRVIKWNEMLQKRKQEKEAEKASMPEFETDASDFLTSSLFNDDSDELAGGAPMIKLGDASIAAPFTCRSKALTSVCDVIRLGRSTLVTTHMMYKILAVHCLNTAFSLSVLVTDGVKLSEKQMIASGVIMMVCFMFMGRCRPVEKLCPQRPVTRIFHPYVMGSVFCQFALHLYCMIQTTSMVRAIDQATVDAMKASAGEEADFKPTLLNSAIFLMDTLQGGLTFAVNYAGEPFMQRITRNRPMFIALIIMAMMVFAFASEADPELNEQFEIVAFPSEDFRNSFMQLLMLDVVGCFAIDRVLAFLFTDL